MDAVDERGFAKELREFSKQVGVAGTPILIKWNVCQHHQARLRQLIVHHPLERFLIKGFLAYLPEEGVVRFAPQLWGELRFWELLDIRQSADEQLEYYYSRLR